LDIYSEVADVVGPVDEDAVDIAGAEDITPLDWTY
jgi:hypothetical protein